MNYYKKKLLKVGIISLLEEIPVTVWLIIFTTIVSIIAFIFMSISENYIVYFGLMPNNILAGKYIWTLVLHMFVHANFIHLFINMFVLFSLGVLCEKIIGRKRYIWFYVLAGVFAGLCAVFLSGFFGNTPLGARILGSPDVFMVGASGAIFAIAGLYVVLLPKLKFSIIFLPFFTLPAYIMIPGMLILLWAFSIGLQWPIGNAAHFGGFIAGLGYGFYLRSKYKNKIAALQRSFNYG